MATSVEVAKNNVAETYSKTITHLASLVLGVLGLGVIPCLVKSFETTYGLSHANMGLIFTLCMAGTAVASIFLGSAADHLGIRKVVIATIAITAFSAMIVWLLEYRFAFIVALVAFHVGSAHYVVLNSLVLSLYESKETQGMNVFHAIQGIGRLLAPLLVALVIGVTGAWTNVFLLSFLTYGLLAFLFTRMPKYYDHSGIESFSLSQVIKQMVNVQAMLGVVGFCFLAGSEMTLIFWLADYLETNAYLSHAQAMYGLTFMMIGYTGTRFAVGVFSIPVGRMFLACALLLNIACCGGLLFVRELPLLYVTCVGLGASFGAFWPSLASLLSTRISIGRGMLMGLITLGSLLGSAVISQLMVGWLADIFSLHIIFLVAPVCTIVLVVLFFFFLNLPVVKAGGNGVARADMESRR